MVYNVRDYGAVGDGVHLDSPAVQALADACRENGGGTILFPAGNYLCASVRLYDNTCVYIEAGATVLLCAEEEPYTKLRGKYDEYFTREPRELIGDKVDDLRDDNMNVNAVHRVFLQCLRNKTDNLFFAKDAKNVSIIGEGAIDGQQMLFFHPDVVGEDPALPRWLRHPDEINYFMPRLFRPHVIVFMGCENIRVSGIKIHRPPFFNIRVLDSSDAHIDHLFISGDLRCVNSDGINISGSKNVFVDSCSITCGDDCIAVSTGEVQPRAGSCENIVVTNCVFNTASNMARIFCGIDLDPTERSGIVLPEGARDIARRQYVRNVIISNCVMLGGATAANIHTTYGGIENIKISNLTTNHTHRAPVFFIGAKDEAFIRGVQISGVNSVAHSGVNMLGMDGAEVSDISVTDSKFTVSPTTSVFGLGMPDSMNDYFALEYGPYNINMRHVKDVSLSNVTLLWGEDDLDDLHEITHHDMLPPFYKAQWRPDMEPTLDWPAVYGFDCENVSLRAIKAAPHGNCDPTVFENSVGVEIAET